MDFLSRRSAGTRTVPLLVEARSKKKVAEVRQQFLSITFRSSSGIQNPGSRNRRLRSSVLAADDAITLDHCRHTHPPAPVFNALFHTNYRPSPSHNNIR